MKNRSVTISAVFVVTFAALLVALQFAAPYCVRLYINWRDMPQLIGRCILFSFYLCSVPAGIALYGLWILLRNIRKEQIFIAQNSRMLRMIFWCSVAVSSITFLACYHYLPFGLIFTAFLFMALIVRVVQNCFEAGTVLKDENNLTI